MGEIIIWPSQDYIRLKLEHENESKKQRKLNLLEKIFECLESLLFGTDWDIIDAYLEYPYLVPGERAIVLEIENNYAKIVKLNGKTMGWVERHKLLIIC